MDELLAKSLDRLFFDIRMFLFSEDIVLDLQTGWKKTN